MSSVAEKGAVKKYNIETIGYMNAFEAITRVRVKDCIVTEDGLMFIVNAEYIGRVLGNKGENIKKIEERFRKNIRIVEFSEDVARFIRSVIWPLRPKDIKITDDRVEILAGDSRMKGMLIGRDRKNLKRLQELVSRYFKYTIEIV